MPATYPNRGRIVEVRHANRSSPGTFLWDMGGAIPSAGFLSCLSGEVSDCIRRVSLIPLLALRVLVFGRRCGALQWFESRKMGPVSALWVLLGFFALLTSRDLHAHDPGISTAQGELRQGWITLTSGFAPADVEQLLASDVPRADRWAQGEFESVKGALTAIAPELWVVKVGGMPVLPEDTAVELLPGDNVSFRARFALGANPQVVVLCAPLIPRLPAGHRQFVVISDEQGSTLAKKLISAKDLTLEIGFSGSGKSGSVSDEGRSALPRSTSDGATSFIGFLKLGVEHIWTGYDHLLFLLALLIVCQTFRSTFAIVTCFTIAHSLTLGLATFSLVLISPQWVEPMIAASIVIVGVENLVRRGKEPKGRWMVTFGFGLIHGFGFASVLRDLGVGGTAGGVAMPLFAFNLGVEAGQIAVAALVLPIIWRLHRNEKFRSLGVPVLSGAVSVAGLYWLFQRTILS